MKSGYRKKKITEKNTEMKQTADRNSTKPGKTQ